MSESLLTHPPLAEETRGLARSASIIALGNIASRVLGLARDTVKSHYFGATGAVSAYELAVIVPTTVYDLLIGGMVSSALVPVFSDYLAREKKDDLWRLAGTLLALITMVMAAFILVIQLAAPLIADFMAPRFSPDLRALFVQLLRVLVFSLFFLSLSAVLTGLLYALQRFTLPTFTASLFNLGIVLGALALHNVFGVTSLAIGLLVGAALQVVVQLPGLRGFFSASPFVFSRRGMGRGPRGWIDWRHPGLRQIARLYLPIILGLVISNLAILVSAKLIAATGEQSIAWNDYATSLMQFPLGLVVTAVSVAILPTLSQQAVTSETDFKSTLAQGLKLVLALILPAVAGLALLAPPITALLYEHGHKFTATDTAIVSLVLRVQMLGVFFAALDQPLIFAFYARKDTLTPALVGMAGVGLYLGIAFGLSLLRPLTLLDLVFANDAQLAAHALVMLALFRRRLGGFNDLSVWTTLTRAALASLAMSALAGVAYLGAHNLMPRADLPSRAFVVALPGAVGFVAYFWLAARLNIVEVRLAMDLIRKRLGV
jgi:putative peptidoglycan lipid II flippase